MIGKAHRRSIGAMAGAGALVLSATAALAAYGLPEPWQIGMQDMASEVGRDVARFHTWLVWIITAISLFVLALLVVVMVRFNERANPVPSRTTHNTTIEVAWTVVPVLILVAIAIPSFRVLREQLIIPKHDLVVKATGRSWYWEYEYPSDQGNLRFEQRIIADPADQAKALPGPNGEPRLFAVDNEVVVPVNKTVRLQVTAGDVLHAFALPSFSLKLDAVPGRLNETWFRAEREGVYYGQCSELCGSYHAYMPIAIRVVSDAAYDTWLAQARQRFAAASGTAKLAAMRRH
jgi:cytochrome c oxidase subunit 2